MRKTNALTSIIKRWLKLMIVVFVLLAILAIWVTILCMIHQETIWGFIISGVYVISTICLAIAIFSNDQVNNFINKHLL